MSDKNGRLKTVRQFAEKNPAFTEGSLRWLIFNSTPRESTQGQIPGNGLDHALVRIGRRVLIDESRFWEWVNDHRGGAGDV